MATETFYWTGKCKWAKVYKPDPKYNNFVMDFYPDNPEEIPNAGLGLEPKADEDGTFYRLRRPVEKLIKDELVQFGPPKVVLNTGQVDEAGVPVVEPFSKLIGNGSRVTVKVDVFDVRAGKGKGHRLNSVRVDEHVPYEAAGSEKPASTEYPF